VSHPTSRCGRRMPLVSGDLWTESAFTFANLEWGFDRIMRKRSIRRWLARHAGRHPHARKFRRVADDAGGSQFTLSLANPKSDGVPKDVVLYWPHEEGSPASANDRRAARFQRRCDILRSFRRELEIVMMDRTALWPATRQTSRRRPFAGSSGAPPTPIRSSGTTASPEAATARAGAARRSPSRPLRATTKIYLLGDRNIVLIKWSDACDSLYL
jgi:hypothetical protein